MLLLFSLGTVELKGTLMGVFLLGSFLLSYVGTFGVKDVTGDFLVGFLAGLRLFQVL